MAPASRCAAAATAFVYCASFRGSTRRARGPSSRRASARSHRRGAPRHEHLLARLRALDDDAERILFVRYVLGIDEGDLDPQACVAALRAALAPHFRRASFELLLINVPGATADERGGVHAIDVDEAPAAGPEAWRGDDAAWSRALARSGLLGSTRSGRA